MIPKMKRIEKIIIIGILIGRLISGLELFLIEVLDFLAIKRIKIPVVPPEMTPPIPRIVVKVANLS